MCTRTRAFFHTVRPFLELHGAPEWPHLVLIASVHRGIKTVSTALPHIRTNLPLSNFIQPRLVTAEERRVLWAEALTSPRLPVMQRGEAGEELAASESGGWVYSLSQTKKSICSVER